MAPPKGTSPETTAYIDLFKSIGLAQAKASEAAKSAKSAAVLQDLIERHALVGGRIDEKQAGLVAALAVQGTKIGEDKRGYVVDAIIDGRLKSTDQVNGACSASLHGMVDIEYVRLMSRHTAAVKFIDTQSLPVDDAQFDRECGVGQSSYATTGMLPPRLTHPNSSLCAILTGFSITPDALSNAVSEYVNSSVVTGWASMGSAITALRNTPALRWVNPLELKNAVESALADRFGVKEAAKPKPKVKVRLAALPPQVVPGAPYITCAPLTE